MNSEYSTPTIQGRAVPAPESQQYSNKSPYRAPHLDETFNNEEQINLHNNVQSPQQQPKEFQDAIWALVFVLHLGIMAFVISASIIANNDGGGDDSGGSYNGLIVLVSMMGLLSIGLSSATIILMMKYPTAMVKSGLVFSAVLSGAMAIMFLMSGDLYMILLGAFFFMVTMCYVASVWKRIPYAAANLNTALNAVKSNAGLGLVAYLIMALAFGWTGLWMMGIANSLATSNAGIVFLLFVSYYWTFGVLTNTIHVTTAGTVGTWWFVPHEANRCWSSAIRDSFCRATTYSFGSICLGSLLVAVVQALRMMARRARESDDMQLLLCLVECILACIQDIVEYFNKWAYVYVGLYGFGYIEAGRNVIQLFQSKGWTTIITDDLADRVLLMMSIAVGAIIGLIGMAIAAANPNLLADLGLEEGSSIAMTAFLVSFLVGLTFCSILMSVVGSAVNTIIVCFAESPGEFETNHPELSREMRAAWAQAWPELTI
mmetsp:Transcript_1438/g.3154  ORF Transcript_1438/g.3154 Transcript_1438/m.3154 type:complete len:487 (+) Transcript_1438:163-1623(+)